MQAVIFAIVWSIISLHIEAVIHASNLELLVIFDCMSGMLKRISS